MFSSANTYTRISLASGLLDDALSSSQTKTLNNLAISDLFKSSHDHMVPFVPHFAQKIIIPCSWIVEDTDLNLPIANCGYQINWDLCDNHIEYGPKEYVAPADYIKECQIYGRITTLKIHAPFKFKLTAINNHIYKTFVITCVMI